MKIIAAFTLLFILSAQADSNCWLTSYHRGLGNSSAVQCRAGLDQIGLNCYPQCQSGWTSSGATCLQPCSAGFYDSGNACMKLNSYSRGSGYVLWQRDSCERANRLGCEKNGLLWFPVCRSGTRAIGNTCSQNCQDGQVDAGSYCVKRFYTRTVNSHACPAGLEYSQGSCYKPCQKGYQGIGSVCWSTCPAGYKKCGALCVPGQSCSGRIAEIANIALDSIQDLLSNDGPIEKIQYLLDDANGLAGNIIVSQFCKTD